MNWKQTSKKFAACLAGVVTLTAFFGVFICVGMDMTDSSHHHESHHMSSQNCDDFMAENNCQMGVMEHITTWENTFLGFLGMDLTTLLAAVFITVCLVIFSSLLSKSQILQKTKEYIFYIRSHPERMLYQNLMTAYSNGIIQPKIFAS